MTKKLIPIDHSELHATLPLFRGPRGRRFPYLYIDAEKHTAIVTDGSMLVLFTNRDITGGGLYAVPVEDLKMLTGGKRKNNSFRFKNGSLSNGSMAVHAIKKSDQSLYESVYKIIEGTDEVAEKTKALYSGTYMSILEALWEAPGVRRISIEGHGDTRALIAKLENTTIAIMPKIFYGEAQENA